MKNQDVNYLVHNTSGYLRTFRSYVLTISELRAQQITDLAELNVSTVNDCVVR